jgi:pimeloyl-ACP methyl ester carboxylesterase
MKTQAYSLSSRSGERLNVLLHRPEESSAANGRPPLVVSCHGLFGAAVGNKNQLMSRLFTDEGFLYGCFDFSSHGESTGDLATITVQDWLLDLASVLDFYRQLLERSRLDYLLIGSSLGGRVAWLHATGGGAGADALGLRALFLVAPLLNPANSSLACADEASWTPLYRSLVEEDAYARADRLEVPLCLVHGRNDELLPWSDSGQLTALLREQEKHHEFHLTEADHQFSTDEWRRQMAGLSLAWARSHLL